MSIIHWLSGRDDHRCARCGVSFAGLRASESFTTDESKVTCS